MSRISSPNNLHPSHSADKYSFASYGTHDFVQSLHNSPDAHEITNIFNEHAAKTQAEAENAAAKLDDATYVLHQKLDEISQAEMNANAVKMRETAVYLERLGYNIGQTRAMNLQVARVA